MIPHKIQKYRAILDLSFIIELFGMEIPSLNELTNISAPHESMQQIGNVLPRSIKSMENAPQDSGNLIFSKINIKDGFWRLVVQLGQHLNFAYVLPDKQGNRTRLVLPKALQMGWHKSPSFFCTATETEIDVAEQYIQQPTEFLKPHLLEDYMLPPDKWPDDKLSDQCFNFLRLLEVYVENFCTMVQTTNKQDLQHISQLLLTAIREVFLPSSITGRSGGDPISFKKS